MTGSRRAPEELAEARDLRDAASVLSDADVAALYGLLNPWDPGRHPPDAFYHRLVMAAGSVLDVGCGTGAMLHHARDAGHRGRLAGTDPDAAALARARRRNDATGRTLRVVHEVESVVDGAVTVTETVVAGEVLHRRRQVLRFLDPDVLNRLLREAGFRIDHQYGDWHGGPLTSDSREIVTVARRQ